VRRFLIRCGAIHSFPDFVAAVNEGLVRPAGGEWNGNLDAFNDYLSWSEEEEYEIELLGSAQCAVALGHEAMAEWLRERVVNCHPSNIEAMRTRLAAAEAGQGHTLFDALCEIVADNRHVRLVLS
jgi:hypothetical protein